MKPRTDKGGDLCRGCQGIRLYRHTTGERERERERERDLLSSVYALALAADLYDEINTWLLQFRRPVYMQHALTERRWGDYCTEWLVALCTWIRNLFRQVQLIVRSLLLPLYDRQMTYVLNYSVKGKGKGSSLDIAPLTILDSGALQPYKTRRPKLRQNQIFTSAKEIMFSPVSVCLSVCLPVKKIIRKLLSKALWYFFEWLDIILRPID